MAASGYWTPLSRSAAVFGGEAAVNGALLSIAERVDTLGAASIQCMAHHALVHEDAFAIRRSREGR